MRDDIERYRAAGTRPLGVNPAPVDGHAAYARRLALPFPLLSDAGLAVASAYGAVDAAGRRVVRTVYRIDPDGTVGFAARGAPSATAILSGRGAST